MTPVQDGPAGSLAAGGAPLAAFLEAAVPLWLVAATAGLGADRLVQMTTESAQVLDSADWSGGPSELPAAAANHLARAIALAAAAPGGTTFAGRHWCAAPHDGCPGPGKAGEPAQVVRELTGRGFDHE